MFVDIRNKLRYLLGRNQRTIQLYKLKKKNRPLIINPKHNICIEGYPRSANTFAVLLVEQCTVNDLQIAHHMHTPSQLIFAQKRNIPSVLVIRNPIDAVISNVLREKGMSLATALNWYIDFHKRIIDFKGKLIIWPFEKIVSEPTECLSQISDRWPQFSFNLKKYAQEHIFEEIDRLDHIYKKTESKLVSTRPQAAKKEVKKYLKKKLLENSRYSALLTQANKLYKHLLEP